MVWRRRLTNGVPGFRDTLGLYRFVWCCHGRRVLASRRSRSRGPSSFVCPGSDYLRWNRRNGRIFVPADDAGYSRDNRKDDPCATSFAFSAHGAIGWGVLSLDALSPLGAFVGFGLPGSGVRDWRRPGASRRVPGRRLFCLLAEFGFACGAGARIQRCFPGGIGQHIERDVQLRELFFAPGGIAGIPIGMIYLGQAAILLSYLLVTTAGFEVENLVGVFNGFRHDIGNVPWFGLFCERAD